MEGGATSAVQRLRQQFEVLDGLAKASPAGPVRPSSAADSARPGGRKSPRATPAVIQHRRPAGVGGPVPVAAAGATAGGTGLGKGSEAKSAPAPSPSVRGDRVLAVTKSPTVLKRTPAVVTKNVLVTEVKQPTKTESAPAAVNVVTNGSSSPVLARTVGPQLCNGVNQTASPPSTRTTRTAPSSCEPAVPAAAPSAPTASVGRPPSPVPPCDAPPRPPKPSSDTSSVSGDGDAEPGDYLVPDGVPPVPPREPLSPEWGPARSPLVRRSLPPPPSGVSLQQQAWFHPVDRAGARALILRRGNGAFVVRPSQRGGAAAPFALTLLHAGQVYNFNVRQRSDGRFALGYHKKDEASFRSVEELVRHHQREPISLPTKARTCLTWYPSSGSSSP